MSRWVKHGLEVDGSARRDIDVAQQNKNTALYKLYQGRLRRKVQAAKKHPDVLALYGYEDVFISCRFGEARAEAEHLRGKLVSSGVSAFVCNILPGGDIEDTVIEKLHRCKLAVTLATRTYGQGTVDFSTKEELRFIKTERKPLFLVKMVEGAYALAWTRFKLPEALSFVQWLPGKKMPAQLVPMIKQKLDEVRS